MKRRDRHGRGLRGPVSAPNPISGAAVAVRQPSRGAALFAQCLRESVAKGEANCPRAFIGLEVGFEDVPNNLETWWADQVPLATASSAQGSTAATIVLFRRPLEHRSNSTAELRRLVHRTLMQQLAALTGIGLDELAPEIDPEDWD